MLHHLRLTTLVVPLVLLAAPVHAQERGEERQGVPLTTLVAEASAASPRLRVARARVEAAQARVAPAGARPDPMLMVGLRNLPVRNPGFADEMTMKMVGASQTFITAGKLGLARSAAEREVEAAEADLDAATLELRRDVRIAWYEIAYADRALELLTQSQHVLLELARATELRYAAGVAGGGPPPANPAMSQSSAPVAPTASGEPIGATRPSGPGATSGAAGMSGMTAPAGSSAGRAAPASGAVPGTMPAMGSTGVPMGAVSAGAMPSMNAGSTGLLDVVRARIEATRLGEEASALRESRRSALARLNALLDRPTDSSLDPVVMPDHVRRAAVADSSGGIRFESAALGSRVAGSPLPPLAELQDRAVRENASLRAHEATIGAQRARALLAARARIPDVELAVEYGQRDGMPDMVSAVISLPLPLQRRRVQDQFAASARAELSAQEAEHHVEANRLRAEVARLYGDLERDRAQLALLVKAVLPPARVAIEVALAGFRNGRGDLVTALGAQAALFGYETTYHRTLTSFATTLATLEQTVGGEVLP